MNRTPLSLAVLMFVVALAVPLAGTTSSGTTNESALETFGPGSLIIPMDTSANGQDSGMLRANGLVYALLRNHVPVHWTINASKGANGDDFLVGGFEDVETGATGGVRVYRGGPFVIAAGDAEAALPIIQAWQATFGDNTVVHRLTVGSFSVTVDRTLTRAPRIAILIDGNEAIAFNYLNSAGILDSSGSLWSSASPDALTELQVSGLPDSANDGALFHASSGLPRFCYLASMSYVPTAATPQVVPEVRSWLDHGPLTHAFMQNSAVAAYENDASGRFLTTAGIQDDGSTPAPVANRIPADPLAQIDGALTADLGALDSIGLAGGSTFQAGVRTLFNDAGANLISRVVLLTGRLDGGVLNGQVTYLSGHDYSVALPVSTNPQTNGVRLFLNSVLTSGCAVDPTENATVTKLGPAVIGTADSGEIEYSITYLGSGARVIENFKLTDRLPSGTTFVSTPLGEGGTHSDGVVTWHLGSVEPGGTGTVHLTVATSLDATYTNVVRMDYSDLTVHTISSNAFTTVRDTTAPTVTIPGAPVNRTITNDSTPTFAFEVSTGGTEATVACRIDAGPFGPCTHSTSFTPTVSLGDGPHSFSVLATDAAGNIGQIATHAFEVDTIAPVVTIPGAPNNPTSTNDSTPTFIFSVSSGGTPTTAQCRIDSLPFVLCSNSFTAASPLGGGAHVFSVIAADAAGNIGPSAEHPFVVATAPGADTCTTTPVLDNFNRANGLLGSNWQDPTKGAFAHIKGNRVDVQGGGPLYWAAESFGTTQAAFITLGKVDKQSKEQGVLLKVQPGAGPETGAIAVVYDGKARAVRVLTRRPAEKKWVSYAATPAPFADGDQLGACVSSGGDVRIYKNQVLVTTVTLNAKDKTFFNSKGGKIGLWAVQAAKALFDDFGGGTVAQ